LGKIGIVWESMEDEQTELRCRAAWQLACFVAQMAPILSFHYYLTFSGKEAIVCIIKGELDRHANTDLQEHYRGH
jgi:hypothetical protein